MLASSRLNQFCAHVTAHVGLDPSALYSTFELVPMCRFDWTHVRCGWRHSGQPVGALCGQSPSGTFGKVGWAHVGWARVVRCSGGWVPSVGSLAGVQGSLICSSPYQHSGSWSSRSVTAFHVQAKLPNLKKFLPTKSECI